MQIDAWLALQRAANLLDAPIVVGQPSLLAQKIPIYKAEDHEVILVNN